jgi:hypothetical protein
MVTIKLGKQLEWSTIKLGLECLTMDVGFEPKLVIMELIINGIIMVLIMGRIIMEFLMDKHLIMDKHFIMGFIMDFISEKQQLEERYCMSIVKKLNHF